MAQGKNKPRVELTITISADTAKGLKPEDIESVFEGLGKQKNDPDTVNRKVQAVVKTP
jgi:hypothetical protein